MDFGKIPEAQLPLVDFRLPPDTKLTEAVLQKIKTAAAVQVYTGCAKWGRKEWVGMIYPEKTRESGFLDEYIKHFNSIELNAVFYAIPKKEQVKAWREKAEAERRDFKFCPKFSRSITHIRRLKNAEEDTSRYLESISEFGNYLGPCFLQLSDNFGPKGFDVLKSYLEKLPEDLKVFVEVRHTEWFSDKGANRELFEMLHELKKGAVITDSSGRRDCVHMELPIPETFIRFVGNGLRPTDFQRVDDWAYRIKLWAEKGLTSVYFFLHQHDEKDTPILAQYSVTKFNELLGTSLEVPKLISRI